MILVVGGGSGPGRLRTGGFLTSAVRIAFLSLRPGLISWRLVGRVRAVRKGDGRSRRRYFFTGSLLFSFYPLPVFRVLPGYVTLSPLFFPGFNRFFTPPGTPPPVNPPPENPPVPRFFFPGGVFWGVSPPRFPRGPPFFGGGPPPVFTPRFF